MACVDVALGAVGSADLVVTGDGTTETALGEVLTDANVRTAALADTPLGGIGSATEVQVAETAGDCLTPGIPLTCDGQGWANCYKWAAADLATLATCAAGGSCAASADPAWDGTCVVDLYPCAQNGSDWFEQWDGPAGKSLGGKELAAPPDYGTLLSYYSDGYAAFYFCGVYLMMSGGCDDILIDGYKYDGADPTGEYTDGQGTCPALATFTIEECPA
jgi:hypothetical protein